MNLLVEEMLPHSDTCDGPLGTLVFSFDNFEAIIKYASRLNEHSASTTGVIFLKYIILEVKNISYSLY